ncbi:methionyl-tRNA formyltransferase [Polynucleobacter meluiroseus]|uniref:Methionyl-tRNA formyltransferase n=1 Tax=Polynucleobacter meluiroseus TaxID=1938814 RepID=A0A240E2S4_9BURK|nr:methionyl-tRNA formyltransferase [Polynucleobacter meluiroseus]SNX28786.1 methionyl-tRNA formyltransferase [Polynucleobacter meluiroseus]
MKIVFAGTPEFAAHAMRAIEQAGHEIVLVLTQPDRRAGRGMQLHASPVKLAALEKQIPLIQPESLKRNASDPHKQLEASQAYALLNQISFDAMVVVAYGLILPQEILDVAQTAGRHGCFNIHASLLPRWRGAAPIQRAIEAGDPTTGVSIMQMNAGLDTGDVVLTGAIPIAVAETSSTLHDKLAVLGATLVVETLARLQEGKELQRTPQPTDGITYAEKILKKEAEIDWALSAVEIDRRIRAFNPFPGSTSSLNGEAFKFWQSAVAESAPVTKTALAGEVLGLSDGSAYIQCGQGVIEVQEMQKPGGKKMSASACLQSATSQENRMQFLKE